MCVHRNSIEEKYIYDRQLTPEQRKTKFNKNERILAFIAKVQSLIVIDSGSVCMHVPRCYTFKILLHFIK